MAPNIETDTINSAPDNVKPGDGFYLANTYNLPWYGIEIRIGNLRVWLTSGKRTHCLVTAFV